MNIRELCKIYNFKIKKSLGQNFLEDEGIIADIIEGSGIGPEDTVIEIGPGLGALTSELAMRAKRVYAIEIDQKIIPILKSVLAGRENTEIINADIMDIELGKICKERNLKVIGNLPYYITSPIIMKLLEENAADPGLIDSITIMMQKEVAKRVCSEPGSKDYGVLSVSVQYYARTSWIADAPRTAFYPSPEVDSAVIRLDLDGMPEIRAKDEKAFFRVVKAGFGRRRKTLANALAGAPGMDKAGALGALAAAGIEASRRAETLSVAEFIALSDCLVR